MAPTVLVRLDSEGTCKFSQPLQMLSNAAVVYAPGDGFILVGGTNDGAMLPHGGYDAAFRKFDGKGMLLIDKLFGDDAMQNVSSIAIDPMSGKCRSTRGANSGALDFGAGPAPVSGYTAVLTSDGTQVGPFLPMGGNDVAFAPEGLVLGGTFSGTFSFGGVPIG